MLYAQDSLPDAPKPDLNLHTVDKVLLIGVAGVRLNDAASTRWCQENGAREAILPQWMADSTPAMVTLAVGATLGQYVIDKAFIRWHHRNWARVIAVGHIAATGYYGIHNWTIFNK